MSWIRRVLACGGAGVLALVSLALGYEASTTLSRDDVPIALADHITKDPAALPAEARALTIAGMEVGALLIDGEEVLRLVSAAGELSPLERVDLLAMRLNRAIQQGMSPRAIHHGNVNGQPVVQVTMTTLLTINAGDASQEGKSPETLAKDWAASLSESVARYYARTGRNVNERYVSPVETRTLKVNGKDVGLVLINGKEVVRLTSTVGGLTPPERAHIVAVRVDRVIQAWVTPSSIQASSIHGRWIVKASDAILLTVDPMEARQAGKSSASVAKQWAEGLSDSISMYYARFGESGTEIAATTWTQEEPYDDKWVPILSVLEGVRIGVARVNGPSSKVRLVQAVAQLETHFKDFLEIDVYLPISTKVPGEKIDLVKGCAVTGLGDFKL